MKLCFLTDSIFSIGGVQRVLAVIANALSKEHDVTIMTFDNIESEDVSMYNLEKSTIHYEYIKYPAIPLYERYPNKSYSFLYKYVLPKNEFTSRLYGYSSFPKCCRRYLTEKLASDSYDVIIGVHAFLSIRLATISTKLNGKTVAWIHNSYEALFEVDSAYLKGLRSHFMFQMRLLDRIVVLTEHDKELYSQKLHLSATRIYNPITLEPHGFALPGNKRFLAIGRFSHLHKGFDILIRGFHLFAEKNKDWTLDIVGEGPEESLYHSLIAKYQLEKRVHIYPFTRDVQSYYVSADFYVLSSRWEGFGLVLLEAMAHGLPIISSDIPTSNYALFFKNGDFKDLSRVMEKAVLLPWKELSDKALKRISPFNVNAIVKDWNHLLDNIDI